MSDPKNWATEFFVEFVQLYQNNPCLWQKSCSDYGKEDMKESAYLTLLEKVQEIDVSVDVSDIKDIIDTLENTIIEEYTRLERATELGESCEPAFWYYQLMSFLIEDQFETVSQNYKIEAEFLTMEQVEEVEPNLSTIAESEDFLESFESFECDIGTREVPRKFMLEFINIYKNSPCLWKRSCEEYGNKLAKKQAYAQLLDKWQEIHPHAILEHVKLKINSLRTSLRREALRVKKAKNSGKRYVPSLWYYNSLLCILNDQNDEETNEDITEELDYENIGEGSSTGSEWWRRNFKIEFINLYKELPSLWKVDSPEYKNRALKKKGYEMLLEKVREYDPKAEMVQVKSKINQMRSSFRREALKVKASRLSDDPYVSKLWYYDLFTFLLPEDDDIPIENSFTSSSKDYLNFETEDERFSLDSETRILFDDEDEVNSSDDLNTKISIKKSKNNDSLAIVEFESAPTNRKRKRGIHRDFSQNTSSQAKDLHSSLNKDSFDTYGKHVANKLRILDKMQNIFAQKVINEILYAAEMDTLNSSVKIGFQTKRNI